VRAVSPRRPPRHPSQSDEYLRKLESLTLRLTGAFPGEPPMDRLDVAKLVMELMQVHPKP